MSTSEPLTQSLIGSPTPADETRIAADKAAVAALDLAYQEAVKRNDADTIDRILHPQFAMILGNGAFVSREEILQSARSAEKEFEIQDEEEGTQEVRVWGDTAVVTALLNIRGRKGDERFERRVWFSDTYVRTGEGWRYAFAQVSLPLPQAGS